MSSFEPKESKTSFKVGILSPRNEGLNLLPASSFFRSASVHFLTSPCPLVVLSKVWSWRTMTSPSALNFTSNSIAVAPWFRAVSNETKVFSGAYAHAPRCAKTIGVGKFDIVILEFYKVRFCCSINQLSTHHWFLAKVPCEVNNLITKVTWMGCSQSAVFLDIPLLKQVG